MQKIQIYLKIFADIAFRSAQRVKIEPYIMYIYTFVGMFV